MIYPDRCMLKWQGMLLSDHNERMKLDQILEVCEKPARYHTEAEYEAWDRMIRRSWQEAKPLQLLIARPGEPEFSITGTVRTIRQGKIHFLTDSGLMILLRHEIDGVDETIID